MRSASGRRATLAASLVFIAILLVGCSPSGNRLAPVRFWAYQLQHLEEPGSLSELSASRYDLVVVDQIRSLKGRENHDSKKYVSVLKRSRGSNVRNKLVIAYIDVGEAESYRWYWRQDWRLGRPDWIVAKDPDGWDGNFPVKFWRPQWKAIMHEYIDRVIDDGYDGMYLDWLEIYSLPQVQAAARDDGLNSRRELIRFVADLAGHARSRRPGFLFIAQNAAEMGSSRRYVQQFDAIAQEAVWYDGAGDPDTGSDEGDVATDPTDTRDYLTELAGWQRQGKVVFVAEYAEAPDKVSRAYRLGRARGFKTYVTTRPLDRLSETPPPGLER